MFLFLTKKEVAEELIRLYAKRQKIEGYAFSKDTAWQKEFEDSFEYVETNDQLRCIDEVKKDITDITMIAYHDKETSDIYPSIGIFDDKENLLKDKKPSGLILVGYIPYKGDLEDFNITMKVLVKYKINNKEYKIHCVTKK